MEYLTANWETWGVSLEYVSSDHRVVMNDKVHYSSGKKINGRGASGWSIQQLRNCWTTSVLFYARKCNDGDKIPAPELVLNFSFWFLYHLCTCTSQPSCVYTSFVLPYLLSSSGEHFHEQHLCLIQALAMMSIDKFITESKATNTWRERRVNIDLQVAIFKISIVVVKEVKKGRNENPKMKGSA